jgi:hypothetical protein
VLIADPMARPVTNTIAVRIVNSSRPPTRDPGLGGDPGYFVAAAPGTATAAAAITRAVRKEVMATLLGAGPHLAPCRRCCQGSDDWVILVANLPTEMDRL